jgi:hypothetical protein
MGICTQDDFVGGESLVGEEISEHSYGLYSLRPLTERIADEIRSGNHILSASYLSRKCRCSFREAQLALVAMTWSDELETHYQVVCSGPSKRRDVDLEFDDMSQLPIGTRRCNVCDESYTPTEVDILVYFAPTASYKMLINAGDGNNSRTD